MEKDYYKKIDDYNLLEPGDVLSIPPGEKALHVSPQTLARHGLSVGTSCTKSNGTALVSRIFTETRDTGCMLMVSKRHTRIPDWQSDGTLINAIPENPTFKPLESFSAHVLDGSRLPTAPGASPRSSIILPVQPLADAVAREFPKFMAGSMWSRLDSDWEALDKVRRYALGSYGSSYSPATTLALRLEKRATAPAAGLSSDLLSHLFRSCKHGRGYISNRDVTLKVEHPAFLKYLFSHGVEIRRPQPKMWTLLAKRVLAQYARELADDITALDSELDRFMKKLHGDIREFAKFKKSWTAVAAKYGKEVACH